MGEGRRRDGIDVARALALGVVVLGHLSLAVIDRAHGDVRGANLLELRPGWAWIASMAPMPVFFAAAGWANATATARPAAARLRVLAGLGAVVVGCWTAAVVVAFVVTGESGVVGDGARIATQPLWFLAAYAPMAAGGRRLATVAVRHPVGSVGGCLATLAALDVARFALDAPGWIGWPGFYLAWGTPWLVGGWWRHRVEQRTMDERRAGVIFLVLAGGASLLLVHLAGYSPTLIDVLPGARSNTTPPTLYTATAGLAQVGVLLVGARLLDRVGRRWRGFWDRAGEAAIGVYVWHLTALSLCGAVIALGLPVPSRLSASWWLTRPVWFAVVLAVTGGLVGATERARASLRQRAATRRPLTSPRAWSGTIVMTVAAAAVGLEGPRTPGRAVAWTGLFVLGWALLRGTRSSSPTR